MNWRMKKTLLDQDKSHAYQTYSRSAYTKLFLWIRLMHPWTALCEPMLDMQELGIAVSQAK